MVFDYFAFAENDELTGVKVTDALEFTEFASRDTDKETCFDGFTAVLVRTARQLRRIKSD